MPHYHLRFKLHNGFKRHADNNSSVPLRLYFRLSENALIRSDMINARKEPTVIFFITLLIKLAVVCWTQPQIIPVVFMLFAISTD